MPRVATIISLDAISATGAEHLALTMAQVVEASDTPHIRAHLALRKVPSGDDGVSWGVMHRVVSGNFRRGGFRYRTNFK